MTERDDYPFDQALNDLETFFKKNISDPYDLDQFLEYLEEFRDSGRISARFIHKELMDYRKHKSDYFPFSDDERQMFDSLLHFWA